MHLIATPAMGRRRLVVSGLAAAGALMLPPRLAAQQAGLVATPPTTAGPFYPVKFPPDVDNDLVVLRGNAARAEGAVTHVAGRVLGLDGKPIAGATVEIWQCDARGRYIHPGDVGGRPRDKAFQGYGRTVSGADGGYRFRTIKPVPYPGRTPHIHFAVQAPGRRELVTQMYVAGEPGNNRDGLYRSIRDPRQRAAVTVRLEPANGIEEGALAGSFDLVLA
ncbi:MAG TPA: protocatechuate 3,4-dioxygenase [Beijerinckiaceae bacterium]|jgi:protocatechuate 3,4-dioxygenase beta subunit|nr:intradiol ring-cleavage dioxygenase [Microvirga sp.]HZB38712.1 protocatechuate 3,4-dioxygenase [Beijerinckiaceae bacterium]